jgi:hypothetical protein
MKNKNALKKAAIKLDLEKIEIDVLSDSMLNSLQGGYLSQYIGGDTTCISTPGNCTGAPQGCCTQGNLHSC